MAKHIPMRMCVGCRQMHPKDDLIKVTLKNNEIEIDFKKKNEGRGAYFCKSIECIGLAKKKKALSKHFKMPVSEEIYDKAMEYIDG